MRKITRTATNTVVAILALAPAVAHADAPLLGLYTCTEPSGMPELPSSFALLDGSTYATSERLKGKYSYDAKSDIISMVSGPLAGSSYKRIPGTNSFLKQHRQMALACPHSPRNPTRYPW